MTSGTHKFPDSASTDICRLLMVAALIAFTFSCSSTVTTPERGATVQTSPSEPSATPQAKAKDVQEPEIVRVEKVINGPQVKIVMVGNKNGQYSLSCNIEAGGCLSPSPGVDYYVITKDTKWRLKGAETEITLDFIHDWTVTYTNRENINPFAHYHPCLWSIELHGMPGVVIDGLEVVRFLSLRTGNYMHLTVEQCEHIETLVREGSDLLRHTRLFLEAQGRA